MAGGKVEREIDKRAIRFKSDRRGPSLVPNNRSRVIEFAVCVPLEPGVQLPQNGFIYHNGQWATLNYPNAVFTNLVGISNAGVIIGNADTDGGFLYENGAFKIISAPNGSPTTVVGISPKLGLIVGTGTSGGFIAKCN